MKWQKRLIITILIYSISFQFIFAGIINSKQITSRILGSIQYESDIIHLLTIESKTIHSVHLDGIQLTSFILEPLSIGSTVINSTIYQGIELSCVNTGELIITGNEEITDFFLDPVVDEYDIDWLKVISQFAVGTTVIFVTGIVHFISGTSAPIFFVATGEMFTGALTGAISGAAMDALMAGIVATFKGQPREGIFKATLESAASGYMWGAIVGAVTGGISGSSKVATTVSDDLARYLSKGTISLQQSQIDDILQNPYLINDVIKGYTGSSSANNGFMEFFIRLAKGNPDQVRSLLGNRAVRERIDDLIRYPGGRHEWLMTKNFTNFLIDSKWPGDDGLKAAIALNKIVQSTSDVKLLNGLTHKDGGSDVMKWHNELSNVIANSSSFNNAVNNVYNYARETLKAESFLGLREVIINL